MLIEYRCKEVNDDFMAIEVSDEEVIFEIYNIDDYGDTNCSNVILTKKQVRDLIAKLESKLYK